MIVMVSCMNWAWPTGYLCRPPAKVLVSVIMNMVLIYLILL